MFLSKIETFMLELKQIANGKLHISEWEWKQNTIC